MTKAAKNTLTHFDVDFAKFPDVVTFVSGLIKVCISRDSIHDGVHGATVSLHSSLCSLESSCTIMRRLTNTIAYA